MQLVRKRKLRFRYSIHSRKADKEIVASYCMNPIERTYKLHERGILFSV
jgi:hypothetical protein